jgi:hypothetical protein
VAKKVFNGTCPKCKKLMWYYGTKKIDNYPFIEHVYKCDPCNDARIYRSDTLVYPKELNEK